MDSKHSPVRELPSAHPTGNIAEFHEFTPAELLEASAPLPVGWSLPREASGCQMVGTEDGGWQATLTLHFSDGSPLRCSSLLCATPEAACADVLRIVAEANQILHELARLRAPERRLFNMPPRKALTRSEITALAA